MNSDAWLGKPVRTLHTDRSLVIVFSYLRRDPPSHRLSDEGYDLTPSARVLLGSTRVQL